MAEAVVEISFIEDSPDFLGIERPDKCKDISVEFKPKPDINGSTNQDQIDGTKPEQEERAPQQSSADVQTALEFGNVENPNKETTATRLTDSSKPPSDRQDSSCSENPNKETTANNGILILEDSPDFRGIKRPDKCKYISVEFKPKSDKNASRNQDEIDSTSLPRLRDGTLDKVTLGNLHKLVENGDTDKLVKVCLTLQGQGVKLCDKEMLGEEGETTLCLAIVEGQTECAKVLIDYGGSDLIKHAYTNEQYRGASALHLAIMKQDLTSIKNMLDKLESAEKKGFLHCIANGQYFVEHFNFVCTPLSLAAGICDIKIFDNLVQHGADLWYVDEETGNTPLHSLGAVATYFPDRASDMLKEILQSKQVKTWWADKKPQLDNQQEKSVECALLKRTNKDGLTPFTYASCLGATKYAETILDVKKVYTFPQWEIGPSKYQLYEVSEIDTSITPALIQETPNTKNQSESKIAALEIFAFLLGNDKLEYGNIPAVKRIMLNKWKAYRIWFYIWFVIHLLIMILFTFCVQYRQLPLVNGTSVISHTEDSLNVTPAAVSDVMIDSPETAKDVMVLVFEIIVLLYSLLFFVMELVDVVSLIQRKHWQLKSFLEKKHQTRICLTFHFDCFRPPLFLFCLSVLVLLILRIVHSPWQDLGYAVAAVSGWIFMLFFTRAFQNIGIFTIMLQHMMTRELLYFSVVFIVTLLGCGTATFALLQESSNMAPAEVSTIPIAMFSHFRLLIGLEDLAFAEECRLPWMVRMIFFIFVLLGNILLLNMLIAAMNDTYSQLAKTKELFWLRMRTKAVLMLERRLPPCLRPKNNLKNYDIKNKWFIDSEEVRVGHPLARKPSC